MAKENGPWQEIVRQPDEIQVYLATILTRKNISPYARIAIPNIDKHSDYEVSKSLAWYFVFEFKLLINQKESREEIKNEMIGRYNLDSAQQEMIFPSSKK